MENRFVIMEPLIEQLLTDHPRRLLRKAMMQRSQEAECQSERGPFWKGSAPESSPNTLAQRSPPEAKGTSPSYRGINRRGSAGGYSGELPLSGPPYHSGSTGGKSR
jgi:hypothetical protein